MSKQEKNPLLTVINFSGGKQSSALLWMVLLGKLPKPDNLLVLNADPGMENSQTYEYVEMMFEKCKEHDIDARTADGPNLYKDLVELKDTDKTRFDNPPYWVKKKDGGLGRITQRCTKFYKIAPMDRAIRQVLEEKCGISRKAKNIGKDIVEKWIGFAADEYLRIKEAKQKYVYFRYPLIELKMTNEDVVKFYQDNNLPIPPRSVCNACFANTAKFFKEMYEERPEDWKQAVEVDNAVRDLTQIGLKHEIYVSKTLVPLEELPQKNFEANSDEDDDSCHSGYCFT